MSARRHEAIELEDGKGVDRHAEDKNCNRLQQIDGVVDVQTVGECVVNAHKPLLSWPEYRPQLEAPPSRRWAGPRTFASNAKRRSSTQPTLTIQDYAGWAREDATPVLPCFITVACPDTGDYGAPGRRFSRTAAILPESVVYWEQFMGRLHRQVTRQSGRRRHPGRCWKGPEQRDRLPRGMSG